MTSEEWKEFGPKVNKMTNWQRTQWAARGYKVSEIDNVLALKRTDYADIERRWM